ncbi:MAG: exonuclease SbcD, partial [Firmicutes bacterium]|nr:exonuclease SbcD [Bacillota bacterium]
MIWRALIIGDIHWRATVPVARLDNLKLALADKLLECWQIAKSNNVDAIIMPGDVFHSPGIVYSTLADLIWLLREAPAPICAIPGNHDLFASSPESLYRT